MLPFCLQMSMHLYRVFLKGIELFIFIFIWYTIICYSDDDLGNVENTIKIWSNTTSGNDKKATDKITRTINTTLTSTNVETILVITCVQDKIMMSIENETATIELSTDTVVEPDVQPPVQLSSWYV